MSKTNEFEDELEKRRLEGLRYALGPKILAALDDPDVVEIMLNDDGSLWIESLGEMRRAGEIAANDAMAILNQVSSAVDGELSKKKPTIAGELPLNGERFQGFIPPVVERATFAIRKKAGKIFTLSDYVRTGAMTFTQAETLRKAIVAKQNILVVGGTGSGKTTFCNALLHALSELCPDRRMIIMEDTKELQCALLNRVFLRATEWTDMNELAAGINRMRPDSICVGEVRKGGPALEMLKLWNTGHPGGLATVHANSAYEGLERLDELIQEVSANPRLMLIGRAVNICVYLERPVNGRRVKGIIEVSGYDKISQQFKVRPVD